MVVCLRELTKRFFRPDKILQNLQQARFISRKKGANNSGGNCCKVDIGDLCSPNKSENGKKPKIIGPVPKSKDPKECLADCCPDPPLKYDVEFKDQLKFRERTDFQRTWIECPPRRMVQKVECGEPLEEPTYPSPYKTDFKSPPNEDCNKSDPDCPKIRMPGCKMVVKRAAHCKVYPSPSLCEKIKAPYPSFSECSKCLLPKPPPTECNCLATRGVCPIYKRLREKGQL